MKKLAPLMILSAGILWGCMGLFVRHLNEAGLATMDLVFLRCLITAAGMGIWLLICDRRLFRIRIRDIWVFFGTGILSIIFFNFCYFRAITIMSLSVAAVLLYTAPAIVMVLSFFLFHEKFTGRKIIALILTFAGCMFVTGVFSGGQKTSPAGILIGLGAGLGYALYSIFSRYALEKGYHILTIIFYTFLISAVGGLFLSHPAFVVTTAFSSWTVILWSLGFGFAATVFPYLLYTTGLSHVENGQASIIASVEPVMATALSILVYHEGMTAGVLLGMVMVLGGIVICALPERRSGNEERRENMRVSDRN